jgi:hypothetical protein
MLELSQFLKHPLADRIHPFFERDEKEIQIM